jgi:uncharacterized protein YndB with AHSA1/START domain
MKITVETSVNATLPKVWVAYTTSEDILKWNTASPDWHTTKSTADLRVAVRVTFDAETQNSVEQQRFGWQAILDNFAKYVEEKRSE